MTTDQILVFGILAGVLVMLLWGRYRYDLVAFGSLVAAYVVGVVDKDTVFSGFGHPAVIIIALVLIVSKALARAGAIELFEGLLGRRRGTSAHIGVMASVSAGLSSMINNVAALALLMPLDVKAAQRAGRSARTTLMPLSFASILGGMVTLIGTPPNIVIATYRGDALGEPFTMFDFTPVGLTVAVAGIVFIVLIGWRLIPDREGREPVTRIADQGDFAVELTIEASSSLIGESLEELLRQVRGSDAGMLALIRDDKRLSLTAVNEALAEGDVVLVHGTHEAVDQLAADTGLAYPHSDQFWEDPRSPSIIEAVVPQSARVVGRSASTLRLLLLHGVTLLGISRRGERIRDSVSNQRFEPGDILLLMGPSRLLREVVDWMECLPLASGEHEVLQRHLAYGAIGVFVVAILLGTTGLLYLPVALAGAVIVYVLLGILDPRSVYSSVEWSAIVLLAAMIPLGVALDQTGGTTLIADALLAATDGASPVVVLAILMVVTMTLSDVLNNVATALIAAPIGVKVASALSVNPDAFLMGVAVAASCAFLTPIGHKNNIIIMGPGGYRFGDYWRMGLPLELLVLAVGLPAVLYFWPL